MSNELHGYSQPIFDALTEAKTQGLTGAKGAAKVAAAADSLMTMAARERQDRLYDSLTASLLDMYDRMAATATDTAAISVGTGTFIGALTNFAIDLVADPAHLEGTLDMLRFRGQMRFEKISN